MQMVGMDIAEMPLSEKGFKYMLVIIDHFSKYASAYPLRSKSAEEVAKIFLEYWCLREQRFPRQVISDMGREFDNKLMNRITTLTGVECIFSLGYNSQFNGLSERFIQTLKKVLAKRVNQAFEWSEVLPFALFAYNTVPHKATGETPHFLLHGYDAYTPSQIDQLDQPSRYQTDIEDYKHQVLENLYASQEVIRDKLEKYRNDMAVEYNNRKRAHDPTIKVRDLVFVELPTERAKNALSKLAPRWEGPARVVELGKTHAKVKFLHGESLKEIHLSQVVKWQGKESDAQILKGETSRRTRPRNIINSVGFSDSKMTETYKLSELYSCTEEECSLTIGLVLPHSKFSKVEALSARDLMEKVAIATTSKMNDQDKESAFKKADDVLQRPEKISVSGEVLKSVWKAVLKKCSHQADVFKASMGKSFDHNELANLDMVYEMIAYMNDVHYMPVKNMDTVLVGGENAQRIKNAINGNFWGISNAEDSELRGQVIVGPRIKTIVYAPTEKLLYGTGTKFDAAIYIMMQTLDNLENCNSCKVVMLPVFRHLDHPEISQQFISWYKEKAAEDARLIGLEEFDEMKLINWLNATPSNKEATNYVNHQGLLTEAGTRKLVEYMNLLNFDWKHRELQQPDPSVTESATRAPLADIGNPKESGNSQFRGRQFNRGYGNRGRGTSLSTSGRDRGIKRKVNQWMDDASSARGSTQSTPHRRSNHP
uniref:Integrase catalytic domain-containing protein n=1 Tax=Panagrolaimus superbus TaxID=310955 RepID=A0A914YV11_9BILA